MGVTWYIRNTVFSFCGGYTMTSFYNDAVRLGRQAEAEGKRSNKKTSSFAWWGSKQPPTTFSQDVRETIIENEVACAIGLAAFVLAGGYAALAGGFASFMLEGPDGPARYEELRSTYRELVNGM
jgi:hypothetical protein